MEPIEQIIKRAEKNIRTAVKDYTRYTTHSEILDDCSETFVSKLAHDSTYAKQELRESYSANHLHGMKILTLLLSTVKEPMTPITAA